MTNALLAYASPYWLENRPTCSSPQSSVAIRKSIFYCRSISCLPSDNPTHNPHACTYMALWILLLAWLRNLVLWLRIQVLLATAWRECTPITYYFIVILPACPPLLTTCDIAAGLVDIKPSSSARTHCPDVASDMSSRLLFDQTARRAGVDKNLEVAGLNFAHVRPLLFCPIGPISTSRAAESFWPLLSWYILSS